MIVGIIAIGCNLNPTGSNPVSFPYRFMENGVVKSTLIHQVFVGRTARNTVLKAETDDEIRLFRVKFFGSKIPNDQLQYRVIE